MHELCRQLAKLNELDRVLDVGCGIGRSALALRDFLRAPGAYTGVDVMEFAINWCRSHISSEKAEFRFIHVDVYNSMYNPKGLLLAEDYSFPIGNSECTFVLATSLFTHLHPGVVAHYISECSRVLETGGTLMGTWFLLDDHTQPNGKSNAWLMDFPFEFREHSQQSNSVVEKAVAHRRDFVEPLLSSHGFSTETVRYGRWSGGGATSDSLQDIVVARRV